MPFNEHFFLVYPSVFLFSLVVCRQNVDTTILSVTLSFDACTNLISKAVAE